MNSKKAYKRPTLSRYGSVKELTAGGTGPNSEFVSFMFFGMTFEFCVMNDMWNQDINCIP